jgi:hypothetical protein
MASLTNPVTLQNIFDRFGDYVVATANSGISWGTNAIPFPELSAAYFGGTTSGKDTSLTGAGARGTIVNAATIYNGVLSETFRYSNIRNMRAILNVTVTGEAPWNVSAGPRTPGGIIFDQTRKAHLNTGYIYGTDPNRLARGQPIAGNTITRGSASDGTGLEDLFNRARNLYYDFADDTETVLVNVCHASCHASCHSSRSRR